MNDNVVLLHNGIAPSIGEPKPSLIAVLKNLLALAEEGTLQSFMGLGFTSADDVAYVWAMDHPNVYSTLGAIEWMKDEYMSRVTQGRNGANEEF